MFPVVVDAAVPLSTAGENTDKQDSEDNKKKDYRIRGDRSCITGAMTIILFPWVVVTGVDGLICSYPEYFGCFVNQTCCCIRFQTGWANPRESMNCCVIDSANTMTCKIYSQCCCIDYRRECTGICCCAGMGRDPDMLPGSCSMLGLTCFPVCKCCMTVNDVKIAMTQPGARLCISFAAFGK